MATLVFRTPAGPVIQTQVGAADLLATVHAAHSAYGWLGGLDSVRFLINVIAHKFTPRSTKLQNLYLERGLKLLPTRVHVLTSVGPQELCINDAEQCFGNDTRTQLIGLSICALAHELGGTAAVRIFTKHLLPHLFKAPHELLQSMQAQLSDKRTLTRILNEGASRGLTGIFARAIASSGIPPGHWRRLSDDNDDGSGSSFELNFVRGLMVWFGDESFSPYFTRSGLAARVAICLRTVGYMIGKVEAWDGAGNPPSDLDPNTVILVLGGSHPTDDLQISSDGLDGGEAQPFARIHYYTERTVGSLIYNAFEGLSHVSPERLQEDFEHVRQHIVSSVEVKWLNLSAVADGTKRGVPTPFLGVGCEWQETPKSSSIERALAGIFFPNACDFLAPCYRRIASDSMLEGARMSKNQNLLCEGDDCEFAKELVMLRATTACIVIGLTSCLAPDTFKAVSHQTLLQLSDQDWLDQVCLGLDRFASSNITLTSAVYQLAVVHAGYDAEKLFEFNRRKDYISTRTISYRSGAFSILPKLLLDMKPIAASIGLSCSDHFFANLLCSEDGIMEDPRALNTYTITRNIFDSTGINNQHQGTSSLVSLSKSWTGPSCPSAPDRPLYLSLERRSFGEPNHVSLVGRIDGEIVAETSILDTLWTLLRSSHEPSSCDHLNSTFVWNIKASHWTQDRLKKPVGTQESPAYIQVQGDDCWALLVAGESMRHNSFVVNRCVNCAHELVKSSPSSGAYVFNRASAILIGFGGGETTQQSGDISPSQH